MLLQSKPYWFQPDARRLSSWGTAVSILAGTDQTGGAFNLFDAICPAGFTTPFHIHYAEDVAIYVLEGALTFFWQGGRNEACPGSYFFQPRGAPHGLRVGADAPARILYLTAPGALDQFVVESAITTPKFWIIAAAHYGIEILGPLPA